LRQYFGYSEFRPGQEPLINCLLEGRDCLGIMPTGAGKSVCYQIPALLLPGVTIVISPLISLMRDQVTALTNSGIAAAFINSSLSSAEQAAVLRQLQAGYLRILYIAPERLLSQAFLDALAQTQVALVAIDEAHCVSQWGHDFRPSYLQIPQFIAALPKRPPVGAFTATATVQVRDDIVVLLRLNQPQTQISSFDRPNLRFEIARIPVSGKTDYLLEYLRESSATSGIIYCATRKVVEEVCADLIEQGFPATRYHAGLGEAERQRNQDDFVFDRKPIMVATNAFGMGINKSNVGFVIHYNMPKNLEAYYQEAGRAGRDGSPAACLLLYAPADVSTNQYLIAHSDDNTDLDPETRLALQDKAQELLRQMTFYATGNDCLRSTILRYFGEAGAVSCGNCSNCSTAFVEADITTEAQKIISCVYRLREKGRAMGKVMVANILRGSRERRLLEMRLDELSTYGIMKDTSMHRLRVIIDLLVEQDFLCLSSGEYPVLGLSGGWRELLRSDASLVMKVPKEKAGSRKDKDSGRSKERGAAGTAAGTAADWAAGGASDTAASATANGAVMPEYDYQLFQRLRELRFEIAREEQIPAYIVFSDAALREMARSLPQNDTEFLAVNGVGNVKLERYGARFTETIRDYCRESTNERI
jgi:ATP-dependent DNA helicase RecQ